MPKRVVLHVALSLSLCALVGACTGQNSQSCESDSQCEGGGRCRFGACGPACLTDDECGDRQVCQEGVCAEAPECAADADCASGFRCQTGRCECQNDSACAANQACQDGVCQTVAACTDDSQCASLGRRCEVTQGICIKPCVQHADCAPGVDPQLVEVLYHCVEGACQRHCVNDQSCARAGVICELQHCVPQECAVAGDCDPGKLCQTGRCVAFQGCQTSATCPSNHECRTFDAGSCPPGFNCSQKVCQELPRCFADEDCAPFGPTKAFCQSSHCQPSTACSGALPCPAGRTCVSGTCYPSVCRGPSDCDAGQSCSDGTCVSPPDPSMITSLELTPRSLILAPGETGSLRLVARQFDGRAYLPSNAAFSVQDDGGNPSASVSVSDGGWIFAASPGFVTVRASLPGAFAAPVDAVVRVLGPTPSTGRRVTVFDPSTRAPIPGVEVSACGEQTDAGCGVSGFAVTGADGVADFALDAGRLSFALASPEARSDGYPRYDRATVLDTAEPELLVPLQPNPVHAAGGFQGGVGFSQVTSTSGRFWLGFAAASVADPLDFEPASFLGETFFVTVPGTTQTVPFPGSAVLFEEQGFGFAQEHKGRSYGLAQPGRRGVVAFAGKYDPFQLGAIASGDVLALAGSMSFGVQPGLDVVNRPYVADTSDIDRDGRCSSVQQCGAGPEELPDYFNFPGMQISPAREQLRRTEVVFAPIPAELDAVLLAAVEAGPEHGLLPLGFASEPAGAPTADGGTRPVANVLLKSGAPYAGVEAGVPGVFAIAADTGGLGTFTAPGQNLSARIVKTASLPTRLAVPPLLPLPTGSSYSVASRRVILGQPAWNAAVSAGADLARVTLVGSRARHHLYFSAQASQVGFELPPSPPGTGIDPLTEASARAVFTLVDLGAPGSGDAALGPGAPSLVTPSAVIEGFSRFSP